MINKFIIHLPEMGVLQRKIEWQVSIIINLPDINYFRRRNPIWFKKLFQYYTLKKKKKLFQEYGI